MALTERDISLLDRYLEPKFREITTQVADLKATVERHTDSTDKSGDQVKTDLQALWVEHRKLAEADGAIDARLKTLELEVAHDESQGETATSTKQFVLTSWILGSGSIVAFLFGVWSIWVAYHPPGIPGGH